MERLPFADSGLVVRIIFICQRRDKHIMSVRICGLNQIVLSNHVVRGGNGLSSQPVLRNQGIRIGAVRGRAEEPFRIPLVEGGQAV